jgi:hypothetical protein
MPRLSRWQSDDHVQQRRSPCAPKQIKHGGSRSELRTTEVCRFAGLAVTSFACLIVMPLSLMPFFFLRPEFVIVSRSFCGFCGKLASTNRFDRPKRAAHHQWDNARFSTQRRLAETSK